MHGCVTWQLFQAYVRPTAEHSFGIQFNLFMDALNVFGSTPGTLAITYPGANGEVMCECVVEAVISLWLA